MTNLGTSRREFVLDTNVLISDPRAPYKFDEHDVIITMTVLEELDKIKNSSHGRYEEVKKEARYAVRVIKEILGNATADQLKSGVLITDGSGNLRIVNDLAVTGSAVDSGLSMDVADNRVIIAALALQQAGGLETVLVTKDINLQIKAKTAGLEHVEDYLNEQQIDDLAYLTSGYRRVDDGVLASVSLTSTSNHGRTDKVVYSTALDGLPDDLRESMYPNEFVYNENDKIVWRLISIDDIELKYYWLDYDTLMSKSVFGICPKSILQALAINALMDKDIDIVQLTGPAGSGKTLLALAAALEQSRVGVHKDRYDKIIITRTTTDLTDPIGFLPGTEEEKMAPWLAAIEDSMEVLLDKPSSHKEKRQDEEKHSSTVAYLKESSGMQFKSTNFMRGRSIQNSFVIYDEAQNLTPHQSKSLVTRIGKGSKLVVLGNLSQIDNRWVDCKTSGLTHIVEKMKAYEGGSTISLPGGERSRLSAFAEENL
jgi:PhoH-like ATPase